MRHSIVFAILPFLLGQGFLISGLNAAEPAPEVVTLPQSLPAEHVRTSKQFPRHIEKTTPGLAFLPDGQLLSASGHSLRRWNPGEESIGLINRAEQNISAFAYIPKARSLVAAAYEPSQAGPGALLLHEDAKLKVVRELKGVPHPITSLAFSPDTKTLALASSAAQGKGVVQLLDVESGKTTHEVAQSIRSLAFAPNGKVLLLLSDDDTVRYWVPASSTLGEFQNTGSGVKSFALSPRARQMLTVGKHVIVWNLATRAPDLILQAHEAPAIGAAFSADGNWAATSDEGGTVIVWETKNFHPVLVQETNIKPADFLSFGPLARSLAVGSRTHEAVGVIPLVTAELTDIARKLPPRKGLSEPGDWIASAAQPKPEEPKPTDAASKAAADLNRFVEKPRPLSGNFRVLTKHAPFEHKFRENQATLSYDGSLFVCILEQTVKVFDTQTFKELHSLTIDPLPTLRKGLTFETTTQILGNLHPQLVALSLDGRRLAVGAVDGESDGKEWLNRTEVYDTSTWKKIYEVPHREGLTAIALSPEGQYLAFCRAKEERIEGISPGFVRLVDIDRREQLLDLESLSFSRGLHFSADGKRLLVPTNPPQVITLPELKQTALKDVHPPYVDSFGKPDNNVLSRMGESNAQISPDGKRILVATLPLQGLTIMDVLKNAPVTRLTSFDLGNVWLCNGGAHFLYSYPDFGRLELYDIQGKLREKVFPEPKLAVSHQFWLSGDSRRLLVRTKEGFTLYSTPFDDRPKDK